MLMENVGSRYPIYKNSGIYLRILSTTEVGTVSDAQILETFH